MDDRILQDSLVERLALIADADGQALEQFYDSTCAAVFGLVLRILGNASMAEEVTLDTYMQVWRQAKLYDSRRATPRTWLLMIARSRAIDALRSSRREAQGRSLDDTALMVDASPNPEEILSANASREILRSALDSLTPSQREAIELAFYSGLTHSAIASKLGKPLGTIKSNIRLGMMRLRGHVDICRLSPASLTANPA